ncbi:UNVERIFIED_CONTAM: hypothetical protein FKN15_038655 [Acipenser sinensis]
MSSCNFCPLCNCEFAFTHISIVAMRAVTIFLKPVITAIFQKDGSLLYNDRSRNSEKEE